MRADVLTDLRSENGIKHEDSEANPAPGETGLGCDLDSDLDHAAPSLTACGKGASSQSGLSGALGGDGSVSKRFGKVSVAWSCPGRSTSAREASFGVAADLFHLGTRGSRQRGQETPARRNSWPVTCAGWLPGSLRATEGLGTQRDPFRLR